jgi:hypothetical protein
MYHITVSTAYQDTRITCTGPASAAHAVRGVIRQWSGGLTRFPSDFRVARCLCWYWPELDLSIEVRRA